MELHKGTRVRHPNKSEWGLGEVTADLTGKSVRVFFVEVGEKTLSTDFVTLEVIPTEEASDPTLDNLRIPQSKGTKYKSLAQSITDFLGLFPGGFYGKRFLEEERDYKVQAHEFAVELLGRKVFEDLLDRSGSV